MSLSGGLAVSGRTGRVGSCAPERAGCSGPRGVHGGTRMAAEVQAVEDAIATPRPENDNPARYFRSAGRFRVGWPVLGPRVAIWRSGRGGVRTRKRQSGPIFPVRWSLSGVLVGTRLAGRDRAQPAGSTRPSDRRGTRRTAPGRGRASSPPRAGRDTPRRAP